MALSINPLELIKAISEKKETSKSQIIEWLEAVRTEARGLSDAWLSITEQLQTSEEASLPESYRAGLWYSFSDQAIANSRLQRFYNLASRVLGKKTREPFREELIVQLAQVLSARRITRKVADEILAGLRERDITFLDAEMRSSKLKTMNDAAAMLQRELAALDVLIQTAKATPDAWK